ncbi:MAG: hypothetical protein ACLFQ5_12465, partial [Oceanicaulis sp.]
MAAKDASDRDEHWSTAAETAEDPGFDTPAGGALTERRDQPPARTPIEGSAEPSAGGGSWIAFAGAA